MVVFATNGHEVLQAICLLEIHLVFIRPKGAQRANVMDVKPSLERLPVSLLRPFTARCLAGVVVAL